jgi:CheY-like chemotaxis protein
MSGKEVLMKLRQTPDFTDVPVILFSTSSMPLDVDFSQKYRAGFLTKPVDVRQMDTIAAKFIESCSEEARTSIRRRAD